MQAPSGSSGTEPAEGPTAKPLFKQRRPQNAKGASLRSAGPRVVELDETEEHVVVVTARQLNSQHRKSSETPKARKFGLQNVSAGSGDLIEPATLDGGRSTAGTGIYTNDHLNQLRESSVRTPEVLLAGSGTEDEAMPDKDDAAWDYEMSGASPTRVADEFTIRAAKEKRRAVMKQCQAEADYISLNPMPDAENGFTVDAGDDGGNMDDEASDEPMPIDDDGLAGVREYVEEEPVLLDKSKARHRDKQRLKGMQEAIQDMEELREESDDSFEREWEEKQIRHGVYSQHLHSAIASQQQRQHLMPTTTVPIANLSQVVAKLRLSLQNMMKEKEKIAAQMVSLVREREKIIEQKEQVRIALDKAGKSYDNL